MSKGLTAARAAPVAEGLEGVVAAHTVLSDVDGQAGRLTIRGYAVEDLAHRAGFEGVAHLLLDGFFDNLPSDLAPALGAARVRAFAEVAALDEGLARRDPGRGRPRPDRPPAGRRRAGHGSAADRRPGRLHPRRAAGRRRPVAGRPGRGPVPRRRHAGA
jgi:hypothetical protein